MEYNNTNWLGMEDTIVEKVNTTEELIEVYIQMKRKSHLCPCCGESTDKVHDYRIQKVKDLSAFGKKVILHLRKRRYVCSACGKRFAEKNPYIPRYHRRTQRSILAILSSMGDTVSAKHVSKENDVSCSTVWRYFKVFHYRCTSLPEVLSIDEFKGNANGEKYQTIVTDPLNKKILDVLPTRYENDLIRYFSGFSTKHSVKYFVIDMNEHFRRVCSICFPNAFIIADRYHVIRQVFWAMENVRKTEQQRLSAKFRKYFKRSHSLMFMNPSKLSDADKDKLSLMFEIAPRLARAYHLKNKFLDVMHADNSSVGKKLLSDWLMLAEFENMPEFQACITAYHNWAIPILNSLDFHFTNGYTEGCNNKTKVIKRISFGIRNFDRLRTRILHTAHI